MKINVTECNSKIVVKYYNLKFYYKINHTYKKNHL